MLPGFGLRHALLLTTMATGWGLRLSTTPVAPLPAFPGAEGAGRYTSGGRGTAAQPTTVLEVTNLLDDNQPGSLRYAVQLSEKKAPARTIVFGCRVPFICFRPSRLARPILPSLAKRRLGAAFA
jgi:hypothetical protein